MLLMSTVILQNEVSRKMIDFSTGGIIGELHRFTKDRETTLGTITESNALLSNIHQVAFLVYYYKQKMAVHYCWLSPVLMSYLDGVLKRHSMSAKG